MDKAATLFRVFDIAFFVPGAVVFVALYKANYLSEISFNAELNKSGGAILVVVAVAGVYALGLICHALQRGIEWIYRKFQEKPSPGKKSWFQEKCDDRSYELATYFWYVRATCRNLSVALLLSLIAVDRNSPNGKWAALILILSALALFFLGFDFDKALKSVVKNEPSTPPAPAPNQS